MSTLPPSQPGPILSNEVPATAAVARSTEPTSAAESATGSPPAAGAASTTAEATAGTAVTGTAPLQQSRSTSGTGTTELTQGGEGSGAEPSGVTSGGESQGTVKNEASRGGKEGGARPAKRSRDTPLPVGLPKSMVRRIMKLGEDTRNISGEALAIVAKASELFLERFAAQAYNHSTNLGRRTIKYQDVSDVRVKDDNLLFLEAVVPP